jgi:protein-tyrosine-phosphatase
MTLDPDTRYKVDSMVDELEREYGAEFGRSRIEELTADSVERLSRTSMVAEFLPILAYRFTRERLIALQRAELTAGSGAFDIVFVSLSGGGRGQIAAALTTELSGGAVGVHSVGTAVGGAVDPAVLTALEERGIDTSQAFVRPATADVLGAADVIVTMGHSVGAVEIPDRVRHVDWRVGDPAGADLDEVRRVRDDIERRVRALLENLGLTVEEPEALQRT